MSYDLNIWSREKVGTTQKEVHFGEYVVDVDESVVVEKEDIPIPVMLSHSGIKYLTSLHLQPFTTDETITKKVMGMARKLAKESDGIVENPQGDPVVFPAGKKTAIKSMRDAEMVSISWYMAPEQSLSACSADFIGLLETYLPQAVPRRYGSFEPPQFKYAETGKDHLLSFLGSEHKPVLYGTKPVAHIFLSDAYIENQKSPSYKETDFRCNKIKISLMKEAYVAQNWQYAVKRLFKEVARLYKPFYAEITDEEKSMVCAWWWKGIPAQRGNPIIIGEPYSSLFGELPIEARMAPGLYFFDDAKKLKIPSRLISHKKLFASNRRNGGFFAGSFRYAKAFPFKRSD